LGISPNKKIEEFEKADIQVKTISLDYQNRPKESMSFKQIKYDKIVEESWEESYFYNEVVNKKFFFVIFKEDQFGIKRLFKVMFWNMPYKTIETARKYWKDIQNKVSENIYDNFWKISDKRIFHVRPKAKNSKDVRELKDGSMVKKYAYWINANYIKGVISK